MARVDTVEALEAIYDAPPSTASMVKVAARLTPAYRAWIEAAPFCALATVGPEGLDCSPRGDRGQVSHVLDPEHLAIPDRRGNNRLDSLRNIVRDPRVAVMYMIPGSDTVIRVNGKAEIRDDADLLARYARDGMAPRSVIVIAIGEVYFHCARAVMRAQLWSGVQEPGDLPSVGQILQDMTAGDIDCASYDADWPGRAARSLW